MTMSKTKDRSTRNAAGQFTGSLGASERLHLEAIAAAQSARRVRKARRMLFEAAQFIGDTGEVIRDAFRQDDGLPSYQRIANRIATQQEMRMELDIPELIEAECGQPVPANGVIEYTAPHIRAHQRFIAYRLPDAVAAVRVKQSTGEAEVVTWSAPLTNHKLKGQLAKLDDDFLGTGTLLRRIEPLLD